MFLREKVYYGTVFITYISNSLLKDSIDFTFHLLLGVASRNCQNVSCVYFKLLLVCADVL